MYVVRRKLHTLTLSSTPKYLSIHFCHNAEISRLDMQYNSDCLCSTLCRDCHDDMHISRS